MKQLIINKLYIFSIKEKTARIVPFSKGRNIITSSIIDGTKKGKSVILKSIYHTLGADCYYEDKWNVNDKIFIIDFSVAGVSYYIFRNQRLFKIYEKHPFKEIFRTISRHELASFLKSIFDFAVELPNRDGLLEIAPPAYNYILNYLDQDKMDGTNFTSFKGLAQYTDFKDKVLYYHFNVYNKDYYSIVKQIENLSSECEKIEKDVILNQNMVVRVNRNINNSDYSVNMDNLQGEIEKSKEEYVKIVDKLSKTKKILINLRNEKEDLILHMNDLDIFTKNIDKDIKKIVNHECPYCHSSIDDQMELRIEKYNTVEDALYLKTELEASLIEIERKIKKEEERYKEHLEKLQRYEERIKINTQEVEDVLKYKGYIEIRESLIRELGELTSILNEKNASLDNLKKQRKKYDEVKKKVNNKYYELMVADKLRFGLVEIEDKKLENIKSTFVVGGSNKPIATIIWYINLLKLRREFNKDAIQFPLVLDSPNNVETDEEKKHELLKYLFEVMGDDTQLIVSTLGFTQKEFPDISFSNVIELNNEKYRLLSENDFEQEKDFLLRFMSEAELQN